MSLGGSAIDFGDNKSFRGRLGVGLGGELAKNGDLAVTARVAASAWHQFEADNTTNILSVGPAFSVIDDAGGTYGEVAGQINVMGLVYGASAYVKADYRFNGEIEEIGATAGVRLPF